MLRRPLGRHPEREQPAEENHFSLFLPFRDNGIVNRRNELNLLRIADRSPIFGALTIRSGERGTVNCRIMVSQHR